MQNFKQTPMPINRTFRCWLIKLNFKMLFLNGVILDCGMAELEMYYNGGYSPKMVIHEVLRTPVDVDLFL